MKIAIVRHLQGIKDKVVKASEQCWQKLLEKKTGLDASLCPKCKMGTLQIVAELTLMPGSELTVTVATAVLVQPLAAVPVTV